MHTLIWGSVGIVAAAFLWATDIFCRPELLQVLDVVSLVWLEHLVALIVLSPLFLPCFIQLFAQEKKVVFALVFIGVFGSAMGTAAFTYAFGTINPIVPIVLQKLQPFVVVVGAQVLLKEQSPPRFFLWLILGIVGALLLSEPYFQPLSECLWQGGDCFALSTESMGKGIIAVVCALIAVVTWGLSTVFGRYVALSLRPIDITFLRYFFGFCGLFVWITLVGADVSLFEFPVIVIQDPVIGLKLAYMAVGVGLLSLFLYYNGLRYVPAKLAALLELSYVVFGFFFSYTFFDRPLTVIQIIGVLCVVCASFCCTRLGYLARHDSVS